MTSDSRGARATPYIEMGHPSGIDKALQVVDDDLVVWGQLSMAMSNVSKASKTAIAEKIRGLRSLRIIRLMVVDGRDNQFAAWMVADALPPGLEELHVDAFSFSCTMNPPQPCPPGFLDALATASVYCRGLKKVALELKLDATEAAGVAHALKRSSSLEYLSLYGKDLGEEGILALEPCVRELKELKIESCGCREVKALSEVIYRSKIQKLALTSVARDGDTGSSFGHLLERQGVTGSLRELSLPSNRFDCRLLINMAVGLRSNETLVKLDLSGNRIGSEGIGDLAQALQEHRSLKKLNLSHNDAMRSSGLFCLANCLRHNRTLVSLDLSWNRGICCDGIAYLATCLVENVSLRTLDLSGIRIGNDVLNSFSDLLRTNQTLAELKVFASDCDQDALTTFCNMVCSSNSTLQHVNLNYRKQSREWMKLRREVKARMMMNQVNGLLRSKRLSLWAPVVHSNIRTNSDCIFVFIKSRPDLFMTSASMVQSVLA